MESKTYRALTAAFLVLVTACFFRGRGFANGVSSSLESWSATILRFGLAILRACFEIKVARWLGEWWA